MFGNLRILKNFASREPAPPSNGEFEHAHWDRGLRVWRTHADTSFENVTSPQAPPAEQGDGPLAAP
jgi:hypothetical protein